MKRHFAADPANAEPVEFRSPQMAAVLEPVKFSFGLVGRAGGLSGAGAPNPDALPTTRISGDRVRTADRRLIEHLRADARVEEVTRG